LEHAEIALGKLTEFHIKSTASLDKDQELILHMIKSNSGKTSALIFQLYQDNGGRQSYASFNRKLKTLEKGKFVTLRANNTGTPGRSTIVEHGYTKNLQDF